MYKILIESSFVNQGIFHAMHKPKITNKTYLPAIPLNVR